MASPKTVALISASTRQVRLGPFVTSYVKELVAPRCPAINFEVVDLADHPLPIFDEIKMPSSHPADDPTPHYEHEHTKKWSTVVRKYDAFIFVTPQYNWSVPAGLKNALDFLFYEWKGKPAGIVSYGGRGGGKAAAHLRDILNGLSMTVLPTAAGLSTSRKMLPYVGEHKSVSDEDRERWNESGADVQIVSLGDELAKELAKE
jgi:NAD(P)H-dependent FMN reductase